MSNALMNSKWSAFNIIFNNEACIEYIFSSLRGLVLGYTHFETCLYYSFQVIIVCCLWLLSISKDGEVHVSSNFLKESAHCWNQLYEWWPFIWLSAPARHHQVITIGELLAMISNILLMAWAYACTHKSIIIIYALTHFQYRLHCLVYLVSFPPPSTWSV